MKWQKQNAGQYEEDDVLCHPRAGGEGTAWENLPVMQEEPHGTPGLGAGSGNGRRPRSAHPNQVRQSWTSLGRFGSVQDTARPLQERNLVLSAPPQARSNIWGCLAPGECHDLGHCWGGQGKDRITTLLIFLFQSSARMRNPSQSQLPAQVHGSQQRWEPPALGHAGI